MPHSPCRTNPPKELPFLGEEYADFAYGKHWENHRRFKIPVNLDEKWETISKLKDINHDNLPDIITSQIKGTMNMQVLTQVYLAKAPFEYPDKPNSTFEVNGAVSIPTILDVNQDKQQDLVFLGVPFGLKMLVDYFVLHKIPVNIDVYYFNGSGFAKKPDFQANLSFDVPEGKEMVAYATADFDGDKRVDAAFSAGKEKLEIRLATEKAPINDKAAVTIPIPAFGSIKTGDLNQNGREDIVLFHPTGKNTKRIDVVVF